MTSITSSNETHEFAILLVSARKTHYPSFRRDRNGRMNERINVRKLGWRAHGWGFVVWAEVWGGCMVSDRKTAPSPWSTTETSCAKKTLADYRQGQDWWARVRQYTKKFVWRIVKGTRSPSPSSLSWFENFRTVIDWISYRQLLLCSCT